MRTDLGFERGVGEGVVEPDSFAAAAEGAVVAVAGGLGLDRSSSRTRHGGAGHDLGSWTGEDESRIQAGQSVAAVVGLR